MRVSTHRNKLTEKLKCGYLFCTTYNWKSLTFCTRTCVEQVLAVIAGQHLSQLMTELIMKYRADALRKIILYLQFLPGDVLL